MSKSALMFGAGNIGRGFLGQLFYESGYHTTFVDVQDSLVEALTARGEYPLRIVDVTVTMLHIRNVRAVNSNDIAAVAYAVANADIAATAVGVHAMPIIAQTLAAGLAERFADPNSPPLDIIICENLIGAGSYMREQIRSHLDPHFHKDLDAKIGFVEASIGRMVPVMTDAVKAEDPLLIEAEAYCELPVDRTGFKGPIPDIAHLAPRENFRAYEERKLFVHNLGHAATAYLGYLRHHEFIWQAIGDPRIRPVVEGAMAETCLSLHRKHGLNLDDLTAHAEDLRRRFANKALGDQVTRVARDPVRKLGAHDRLIGAAHMCMEQGVQPMNVVQAIAAAAHYDNPKDRGAAHIQAILHKDGLAGVLKTIGGVLDGDPLIQLTEAAIPI